LTLSNRGPWAAAAAAGDEMADQIEN